VRDRKKKIVYTYCCETVICKIRIQHGVSPSHTQTRENPWNTTTQCTGLSWNMGAGQKKKKIVYTYCCETVICKIRIQHGVSPSHTQHPRKSMEHNHAMHRVTMPTYINLMYTLYLSINFYYTHIRIYDFDFSTHTHKEGIVYLIRR